MTQASDLARLHVNSYDGSIAVLAIPGTSYQIHATVDGAIAAGSTVRGRLQGRALKMHRAQAGGCFIEPVMGAPRIIQGRVVGSVSDRGQILLDVGVPMWIEPVAGQDATTFAHGEMLNFYVESGIRFMPVG